MKKTKVLLAGALVLALGLVMGCKQNTELSVEEHRQDGVNKHIWEAEYTGNKYIRSALQFKEDTNVATAKVTVDMIYPGHGKSGILFAVQDRKDDNKVSKYDFYAFAWGWNGKTGEEAKLEAYVDYYQGLTSFNDESLDSEKFGNGTRKDVVGVKDFNDTASWEGAEPFSVDMHVTYDEGAETYALKITKVGDVNTVYWSADNVTAKDGNYEAGMSEDFIVNGEGKLFSYGMLSGKKDPKKVKTTWTLDTKATKSAE